MKSLMLFKETEDYSNDCDMYAEEFNKQHPDRPLSVINDPDKIEQIVRLYGLSELPAILILLDDGKLNAVWQGRILPMKDEVLSYLLNV